MDKAFLALKLPEETRQALLQILQKKMTPQPVKIFSDFKLTCTNYEGIEAIKSALAEGEKISYNDIVVKVSNLCLHSVA
jgi:translation initiation factor 2 subunit 1